MLENDVKDKQGNYEGVYTFQGFIDDMEYWVDCEGEYAIWNKFSCEPSSSGSGYGKGYNWTIGPLEYLGSSTKAIYSSSSATMVDKCPDNEEYDWYYDDRINSGFIDTNDVYIKCASASASNLTVLSCLNFKYLTFVLH